MGAPVGAPTPHCAESSTICDASRCKGDKREGTKEVCNNGSVAVGGRSNSQEEAMAEGRDITAEVKRIINEQLDVAEDDVKPESTFIDDLGADSLGLVELVLAFEEAFEIDIPDEDTEKIRTVQDAVDYIEKNAKS
jgi:acyl carrier protein